MLIPRLDSKIDSCDLARLVAVSYCSNVTVGFSQAAAESEAVVTSKEIARVWELLMRDVPCSVGPLALSALDAATKWLDLGARTVVLDFGSLATCEAVDAVCDAGAQLPKERLAAQISHTVLSGLNADDASRLSSSVGRVIVEIDNADLPEGGQEDVLGLCAQLTKLLGKGRFSLLASEDLLARIIKGGATEELVGKMHHMNGSDYPVDLESKCFRLPSKAEVESFGSSESLNKSTDAFCVGRSLIACLKTDRPDGMFATVVCDELGVALGLVYSNEQSLLASIQCGRGVYWSRSRKQLWRKGDTSGAYQELVSIGFDCDADAVRFKVRQLGSPPSFCHQGSRSCWGEDTGLSHLFRTLVSRKAEAPEGSYTKRLFNDKALLRNKLLEEAQEVVEAVEEEDSVHVAEEVADLAYFLFTASVSGGASIEAVSRVLDARSLKVKRRPGNAKEFRIKAAEAALGK